MAEFECGGESEEEDELGFWVRKWSRSRSSLVGKPLLDRSRFSQFEPDLPAGTEQSIGDVEESE